MTRRLIVVADDLGASPGTNAGIVTAHQRGIVTATSLMVGMPRTAEAASLAQEAGLAVGLHLRLTAGPALTEDVRRAGLATANGFRFLPTVMARLFLLGWRVADAVRAEVRAQMEAFLALGVPPDHVNSHQHLHMHPVVLRAVLQEGAALGFPAIRWPVEPWWSRGSIWRAQEVWGLHLSAAWHRRWLRHSGLQANDSFRGLRLTGRHLTTDALIAMLRSLPEGTTEFMCHPGHPDEELARFTSYTTDRALELATITDPRVRQAIEEESIELTTYTAQRNVGT